ncbi:yippee zinc-binding/DNA-binding /Mis18, centromere assembly-domain-containing protein [Aspergillus unguis]
MDIASYRILGGHALQNFPNQHSLDPNLRSYTTARWAATTDSMFPKFLLPPSIFPTKTQNAGRPASLASPSKKTLLQDHVSCIRCSTCAAQICLTSQIVSKGFTGRHGRAYLVSAGSSAPSPSRKGETLPNTLLQNPVSRHLVTGNHTVSDVDCIFCGSVLGWKYVDAEEESQRYKIGKFILETKRVMTTTAWDPAFGLSSVEKSTDAAPGTVHEGIEFDSQDEDECEDLFSGIWNPELAVRRRNRRIARNTSTPGIAS